MHQHLTGLFRIAFVAGFVSVSFQPALMAAQIPAGQDIGAKARAEREEKERKAVDEKLKTEEVKIEGKDEVVPQQPAAPAAAQTKVLIQEIAVEGNTLVTDDQLRPVLKKYAARELSLSDFQALAAEITDEYRSKGYVTSFAYIPPQKVEGGTLRVAVQEGRVGNVKMSGNKYFSDDFLMRYIEAKKGDFFNYDSLRQSIRRMNERPDVKGQVVLARGEAQGETDVNLSVKDRFPWHFSAGYNNYNSDFLERNKYSMELKSTNLLGFGDIWSTEAQLGEAGRFQLYSTRYLLPVVERLDWGASYVHVDQKLGQSLADLHITGRGDVASTFLSYKLWDAENFSMSVSPAFEYKDFQNRADGNVIGTEQVRIAKLGFDVDFRDGWNGRNLITQEFDFGLPGFIGGMTSSSPESSRPGAEGDFIRFVTNAARIQPMPYSTVVLVKGGTQLTTNHMPAAEQFQVGGFQTVRGYPVSEYSGDQGVNATVEWHIPPYFVPRSFKVPYTTQSLYDSFTFLGFTDWGYVSNNKPATSEIDNESIYSAGLGLRFNLENLSVSFDYAFALGQDASDGAKGRGYVETKLFF